MLSTYSQNLELKCSALKENEARIIDSIGYKTSHENYKSIINEMNDLTKKLELIGYIDYEIIRIKKENDSIYNGQFSLGEQIKTIRVFFEDKLDETILRGIDYKKEEKFIESSINDIETILNTLTQRLIEKGDPFTVLNLKNLQRNNNIITADLNINQDRKRNIDKIIVKGYEKFPKSFLKNYLRTRKGDRFDIEKIKTKMTNLNQLDFSNQSREAEVLFTKDSTILYIYPKKTPANTFDGFLGFGTNEQTNKLEFDGYLNLKLVNNLNYGERLSLVYKSDEIDQQTFRVDASLPFILGSPVNIDLGLFLFRKDSTFSNVSQNVKISYQINAIQNIGIGYKSIQSTNLLDNTNLNIEDFKSNFYNLNYNFRQLQVDDPIFPINFNLNFSYDYGERNSDLGNFEQQAITINAFKIFNLNKKNSIYGRLNSSYLISENYLDNELFRFGGINSIRGFEENSLVANLYAVINTEYRYRLSSTLYVNSVIDAAYFENQITNSKEKLFGFGFGFGLLTRSGLLRFNYAAAKTENSPFRLSDSKVHLSLIARF